MLIVLSHAHKEKYCLVSLRFATTRPCARALTGKQHRLISAPKQSTSQRTLQDEVNQTQVLTLQPSPSQDDMYDTASRLCQVGNKYAFWFMKHKSWVQCAPNIPGYRMLVNTGADFNGNYWYTVKQAKEVYSAIPLSFSASLSPSPSSSPPPTLTLILSLYMFLT